MTHVAVTGLSGVIGSVLLPSMEQSHINLTDLYHRHPVIPSNNSIRIDLNSSEDLEKTLHPLETDAIIHLAAATHIDYCEQDRRNGKAGLVWNTNVESTRILVKYCQKRQVRLIFLSTECVFDGEQPDYKETALPSPKNWYGETKTRAEEYVQSLGNMGAIIRAAIAYHRDDAGKTMFGKFLDSFKRGKPFSVVSDQQVTFTHTPDITKAIITVLQRKLSGIFHISTNQEMSPYDFAQAIANAYHYDPSLAKPVTMEEYLGHKRATLRLWHASLNGSASQEILGYIPQTLLEVLS